MANSVNKAFLIGRVGKDPDTKTFQNGGKIVNFSMATSRTWKDRQSGERKEDTTWHNISVQDTRLADVAERYVRKGAQICIEGEIRQRSWEKDGVKHYMTEIVLPAFTGRLTLLDARREQRVEDLDAAPRQATRTDPRGNSQYSGTTGGGGYDDGDEIPFGPKWR